jgi:hypothetical protein
LKNIHVLPTDKPSRLLFNDLGNTDELLLSLVEVESSNNQHIYITSDEEIKEGDWCYHIDGEYDFPVQIKGIAPRAPTRRDVSILTSNSSQLAGGKYIKFVESCDISELKKIILTTDQDLIKDGVQAIDNKFLEWFIKNPSCEMVEVQDWVNYYKIFIPQEEAKTVFEQLEVGKEIEQAQKDAKIDLAIAEFKRLKSKADSMRDLLYLDGVLTVLEAIKNETFKHEQN